MAREQELLDEAKRGPLDRHELDELRRMLATGKGDTLHSVVPAGRGGGPKQIADVEPFLDSGDTMLVRLAVQILAIYWELSGSYLGLLHRLATGVEWDYEGEVQQIAISALGGHVRRHPSDLESLRLLRSLVAESPDDLTREDALRALARALGDSWDEMPSASTPIEPESPDALALSRRVDATLAQGQTAPDDGVR